jgi:hypothetical protein
MSAWKFGWHSIEIFEQIGAGEGRERVKGGLQRARTLQAPAWRGAWAAGEAAPALRQQLLRWPRGAVPGGQPAQAGRPATWPPPPHIPQPPLGCSLSSNAPAQPHPCRHLPQPQPLPPRCLSPAAPAVHDMCQQLGRIPNPCQFCSVTLATLS